MPGCTCMPSPRAMAAYAAPARPTGVAASPTPPPASASTGPAQAAAAEQLILPIGRARVTSRFGSNEALRGGVAHTGTDYSAPIGTPVRAAAGGTVVHAGWAQGGGGNVVTIDHGSGYYTSYAHQSAVLVRKGDRVGQGDTIGKVGSTGNSTGPHLHFELLRGGTIPGRHSIDAEQFMRSGGTV